MSDTSVCCSLCQGKQNLKKCGTCRNVYYCSIEHQKQDWPTHKPLCKKPPATLQQPNVISIYKQYEEHIQAHPEIFLIYPEEIEQLKTRKPLVQELDIPGLVIFHNFLSDQEHDELAAMALEEKKNAGRNESKTYGHYMSTSQFIPSVGMYYYLNRLTNRLIQMKQIPHMPSQLTINYYEPDEGLEPHIDNVDVIKEWVVGFSLMSSCLINFKSKMNGIEIEKKYPLFPGSVMIQSGEVRYKWTHGIEPVSVHTLGDLVINREFRISLQLSDFDSKYFLHPSVSQMKVKSEG